MPPNVHELIQWSHRFMSQVLGFSPQMQTTKPDALLCSTADSKFQDPFLWVILLPQMFKALADSTAMSVDRDQYRILYPDSLGPI